MCVYNPCVPSFVSQKKPSLYCISICIHFHLPHKTYSFYTNTHKKWFLKNTLKIKTMVFPLTKQKTQIRKDHAVSRVRSLGAKQIEWCHLHAEMFILYKDADFPITSLQSYKHAHSSTRSLATPHAPSHFFLIHFWYGGGVGLKCNDDDDDDGTCLASAAWSNRTAQQQHRQVRFVKYRKWSGG